MNNIYFLLFAFLFFLVSSTSAPDDKKKAKKVKHAAVNVLERGLVENEIELDDIVKNHAIYCDKCKNKKNFENKVLGYVTPWNSRGYDIAKVFANKLDLVSPVWLQIQRVGRKNYQLTGTHDIDMKWINAVKKKSNQTSQLVPRILFERLKMEDLHALFNDEEEIDSLAKMLLKKSIDFQFNGYVLEVYMQLSGHGKNSINHLVRDLCKALHQQDKLLFLVIPPVMMEKEKLFDKKDFDLLKDDIDGFSLMTYDYYSHSGLIGPNAPIDWIRQNIDYFTDDLQYRKKILLGLNFYGMKFVTNSAGKPISQPEPIIGKDYIKFIKNNEMNLKWEENYKEHILVSIDKNQPTFLFYPTLSSIFNRIELARELGTGLSIWELGQGLDYFYDLL
ncbi:chitinase domain-containing 1 [Brachionus plicatilis]|uniref:Chitinase domain-containing protein 1 n=1 Tax=Brachionus plicatilis TaxID=10195 RepID=A0A3M7SWS7_BRAPC|nr:chitinase domain-containing 1 [Brachionus plicatilis]